MKGRAERFLIAAILAVFSYEWLISGLNKWFNKTFVSDMHAQMIDNLPNIQLPFYRHFLTTYGITHCTILAILVETAELCVGFAFALLAVQAFRGRLGSTMSKIGILTCAVAVFMNLNFLFYQSGAVFLNSGDPFDEGVSLDFVMVLIECGMSLFLWNMASSEAKQIRSVNDVPVQKRA